MVNAFVARGIVLCAIVAALGAAVPKLATAHRFVAPAFVDLPARTLEPDGTYGAGACRGDQRGFPAVFVHVLRAHPDALSIRVLADKAWGLPVPRLAPGEHVEVPASASMLRYQDFDAPLPFRSQAELLSFIGAAQSFLKVDSVCVVMRLDQRMSYGDVLEIITSLGRFPKAQLQIFSETASED